MRIGVVGLGRVGSKVVYMLSERRDFDITGFDIDPSKKNIVSRYDNVSFVEIKGIEDLRSYINSLDLLISALPSREGYRLAELASRVCIDLVDVSFISEDPYALDKAFRECGRIYVPDAGFAPGYSNIVAGYIYNKLFKDSLEKLEIYVGGIPRENIPPLGYVVTWSAEDLLEEYVRPARAIINKSLVNIDPLEHIGVIEIPGIGLFEWFYSDGLRTMLRNIRSETMFEATLRWPRHLEKIKLLRDLGFLDREKIRFNNSEEEIIRLTARILEKKLRKRISDMAILYVRGTRDLDKKYEELVVMYGEPEDHATPRFTAIITYSVAELVLSGKLRERGVVAPENLWEYIDYFRENLRRYQPSDKHIYIRTSESF